MSEILLRLLLAEDLTAIRIVCPNGSCEATTEMSLVKLPKDFDGKTCPVCKQAFIPAGAHFHAEYIKKLAESLQGLIALEEHVHIEIVASAKPPTTDKN